MCIHGCHALFVIATPWLAGNAGQYMRAWPGLVSCSSCPSGMPGSFTDTARTHLCRPHFVRAVAALQHCVRCAAADNRDRDDEGEFPLHSVNIPLPPAAAAQDGLRGPHMQPAARDRDPTFDRDPHFSRSRTRDRSPPRDPFALPRPPGRGPGPTDPWRGPSPGFAPGFPAAGELDVERLLEPQRALLAEPEAALDAPFNNVDRFSIRSFSPQPPQPLAEPGGFHAEFEDAALGTAAGEGVGFGTVQVPGMFEGVRPDTAAHNLLDLLPARSGGVSPGGWPPSPPLPAAAPPPVEVVPHPGQFTSQEVQIEDPTEMFQMGDMQDWLSEMDDMDDFKFAMPST